MFYINIFRPMRCVILSKDMVFGQDGKFGYENLIERSNADLASGLGIYLAELYRDP